MKAELNAAGMMRITAETEMEAFALSRWIGEAGIIFDPLATCECARKESMAWKGSRILVDSGYRNAQES